MASFITRFMRNEVYRWVFNNISTESKKLFPPKSKFWVVPVDKGDANYQVIVDNMLSRIEATNLASHRIFDGLGISVLREGEKVLVCGTYQDGQRKIATAQNLFEGMQEYELSFLQKISVLAKLDVKATRLIDPQVWKSNSIFESDIEEYFPHILCLEVGTEFSKDPEDALILRFILSLELGATNVVALGDDLVSVILSMPEEGHDWLIHQLLYATLSGRDSNFFGELYKLVEFFFPLKKIDKLKESLEFKGTHLDLLDLCMTDLGWHVNHQLGSRLALNYASIDFAEIMLDRKFEGAGEQEKKFKEDAMEKITNLRHSLTHQIFKQSAPYSSQIHIATRALIVFLISSFHSYNELLTSS